ncbi:MAG: hypothetical protein WC682_00235 [Parcubacteria group bacterium]
MKNKIEYFQIIKDAMNLTKENKFLWWFGLLSMFGGMSGSFSYNFPNNSSKDKNFDEMAYMNIVRKASFYWEHYQEWIILGIILLAIIFIGLYFLGIIGRGALIDSTFKINKKENVNFSSGFKRGIYFFKRLFLVDMLFFIALIVSMFILIFPIVRLFILKSYSIAFSMGLVAFMLLISIFILFFYLKKYTQMYIISSDLNIANSIKLSYRLFEKNIKESFIMSLVVVAVNMVISMGLFFALLVAIIPIGVLGAIIYGLVGKLLLIIFACLFFLILIGGLIFVSSILNVFFQSIWVLFFVEIAKQKEIDGSLLAENNPIELINKKEIESSV